MILRKPIIFIAIAGILSAGALAVWAGTAATLGALQDVGWLGLMQVCALQLISLALCAAALQLVTPGTGFPTCVTARWIRDGASNLIAIVPGIGEVAGARVLTILGTSAALATAGTLVDVVVEALSQALYTVIGLAPLFFSVEQDDRMRWLSAAITAVAPIGALYLVTRHHGVLTSFERLVVKLARLLGMSGEGASLDVAANVQALYRRHHQVAGAFVIHLAAWVIGAIQVWLAAHAMERPIEMGTALALESIAYAARGAMFVVPWGAGIQEGSFILVGAVLGIDAASALALSLILRARDVLLGLPAVLLWSAVEGRRVISARRSARAALQRF